jgi:hypothetical protein
MNEKQENINELLTQLINITSNIQNDQLLILSKINNLDNRISKIEENFNKNKNKNNNIQYEEKMEDLKDIKNDIINIDSKEFLNAIKYRDYRSVIYIFRLYYKNKNNKESNNVYPLRLLTNRTFQYYCNNKWIKDPYGNYSKNIIIKNIEDWFMKHNKDDDPNISFDDFMLNQEFICNLSNERYKKSIFKNIVEEARVNNL